MPSMLCEIIYLCVFSLLKMICMAAALFQGFQSLEKFRVGAPSTVHSERTLGYMDWAILIIIFHLCNLFEKVDHGHFWDHSFCEICWELISRVLSNVRLAISQWEKCLVEYLTQFIQNYIIETEDHIPHSEITSK